MPYLRICICGSLLTQLFNNWHRQLLVYEATSV